jgi:hypothetical protein
VDRAACPGRHQHNDLDDLEGDENTDHAVVNIVFVFFLLLLPF